MIFFDYDKSTQQTIISPSEDTNLTQWTKIRRLIEDNSLISEIVSPRIISIPWWCFLKIRSNLVKTLKIDSIPIDLSESIKKQLIKAIEHEKEYALKNPKQITDKELQNKLYSVGFLRNLTQHQLRNLKKLLQYPAAATFSVPGAGKTSEALAYFALNKNPNDKLLVVSPRNAFTSWEDEVINCFPDQTPVVKRLHGSDTIERTMETNGDIFLITYQQFYRVDQIIAQQLHTNAYFMFLDESHRMKRGYTGVYGASLLSVCHLPKFKLIMTGTPLPNAIEDLVAQFTFLYPEKNIDEKNIVNSIQHLYVRTTKSELGLKPPFRKEWAFEMKPAQRRLYDNIISETRRSLDGFNLSDRMLFHHVSKCMVRLIQVTTDPGLLVNTEISDNSLLKEAVAEGSGVKIDEACFLARNLAEVNEKSIIWTQFVNTVEGVSDMLSDLNAEYIHGGVETDEDEENYESRESIIRRFHDDPSCMVLVANPAACAEGISLHKVCHNAIYIDRNYNAAHYLQSEDRIHRLGLAPDQDTNIHIFTCNNSIDFNIKDRLQMKIARMGAVLNDRGLSIEPLNVMDDTTGLTFEDIEDFKKHILGV